MAYRYVDKWRRNPCYICGKEILRGPMYIDNLIKSIYFGKEDTAIVTFDLSDDWHLMRHKDCKRKEEEEEEEEGG